MSRIAARRFMNLSWGSRFIVDNLVEYDPINNIECLANGGGKTVQIFLTNCLFVHRSYWRTRDKGDQYELKDYFKGNASPGVVMVEMFLDGSNHRLLIGMIGNNRGGDFNVYTFVYEYEDPEDEMGIRHIPLGTIENHVQKILSIPNAIAMLEKTAGMHIFDMNQGYQATAYYKYLLSYGISTKQWESIVMKINAEEGGITHFFKDTDERGIIRDYLFPIVESKLEGEHLHDQTNIQYIKDTFRSVANKRKQYDDRMKSSAVMESFIDRLETVQAKVDEQVEDEQALKKATDDLRYFGSILKTAQQRLNQQTETYTEKLREIEKQLRHIEQEQASDEYYALKRTLDQMTKDYERLSTELKKANHLVKSKQKDLAILEYAKSYEAYQSAQADIQEGQMRLSKLSDEKRLDQINNLGYSLRLMSETAVGQMQKKMDELKLEVDKCMHDIDNMSNNIEKLDHEYQQLIQTRAVLNVKIGDYRQKEKEVLGYVGDFNMFNRHPDDFFDQIIKENDNSKRKAAKSIADDEKKIASCKKKISELEKQTTAIEIQLGALKGEMQRQEEAKAKADAIIENRRTQFVDLNPLDDVEIMRYLDVNITTLQRSIEEDTNKITEEERHIEKLDGHLNEEMADYLHDHEIAYISGLDYLRQQSQADILVENNPLISYAFIISDEDDFKALKKADLPTVSDPVIFMLRSSMGDSVEEQLNKGTMIYAHRDQDMFDLNKLEKMKLACQERINKLRENNDIRAGKVKTYTDRRYEVRLQQLNQESYDQIVHAIERLRDEQAASEDEKRHLNASLLEIQSDFEACEADLPKQQENYNNCEHAQKHLLKLQTEYNEYLDYLDQKNRVENDIDVNRKESEQIKTDLSDSRKQRENDTIRIKDIERDIEKYDLDKYKSYQNGERISGGFEVLSKQFETLKTQMNGDEAMARELINRGTKASAQAKRTCETIQSRHSLSDEEILDVSYDEGAYEQLQNEIATLTQNNEELSQKTYHLGGQVDTKNDQLNEKEAQINATYGEILKEDAIFGNYESRQSDIMKQQNDMRHTQQQITDRLGQINISLGTLNIKDDEMLDVTDEDVTKLMAAAKNEVADRLTSLKEQYDDANHVLAKCEQESGSMIVKLQTLENLDANKKEVIKRLLEVHENHRATQLRDLMTFFLTNLHKQLDLDQEVTNEYHQDVATLTSRIYEYIQAFHNGLTRIDRYTAVDFDGSRRKLVEIRCAKWNEQAKSVESKLNDYITQCFDQSVEYPQGKALDDFIVKYINPLALYDHTLTLDSIKIYALKIDVDHQIRERWDQYKSGGERTVSSMALVGALMSYISSGLANDDRSRPWSVFIMDNPFAQMTAHRFVKPFLAVAEKQHVQLIMFTGVNEESVQSDAKRIIVSRLNAGRIEVENVIKNESQIESVTLSRQTSIFDF